MENKEATRILNRKLKECNPKDGCACSECELGRAIGLAVGALERELFAPSKAEKPEIIHDPKVKVRMNGGAVCDNKSGPCACGAWHDPKDKESKVYRDPKVKKGKTK